jgi:NAD(P)-dependent dehydrogenase (short-subunit alcohol dehydrogenase family)
LTTTEQGSDGRRALITGAGSGIGRAVALLLSSRGARVALLGRRAERLAETAAGCTGPTPLVLPCDVTDPQAVDSALAATRRVFGGLDQLVNNAGQGHFGAIEQTSLETWNRLLAVNLTGPFLVTRAALPLLEHGAAPAVVNVASTLGVVGLRGASAYCAAKGGLVNWTRALALDLAPLGIRVNAVLPGVVDTEMLDVARAKPDGVDRRQRLAQGLPLGRIGSVEEIAVMIAALLDRSASFVTGAVLTVDGGATAGFAE